MPTWHVVDGSKKQSVYFTFVWAVIATCGAYFCMYMFRKPFTAAKFTDLSLWGLGFKPLLVLTQVLGYTISKFIGVKVVAEIDPKKRAGLLIGLIGIAEVALVGFAITPPPWNLFWLFINGLPLGIVFGLVLGFLEGRRQTEALTAGLCTSFIFADGIAKSVGTWLTQLGVSELWMPACAGAMFIPPVLIFAWMLTRIPAPTAADISERSERSTINREERTALYRRFAVGFSVVLVMYGLVGIVRGVRGDFGPEIWASLGEKPDAKVFAKSELLVGAGVLLVFALVATIRDNRRALMVGLGLSALGCVILGAALVAIQTKMISPFAFVTLTGFGLYLPYLAVHTTVFERIIALTRQRGNIGYLMYLADAGSYAGYVVVLAAKTFAKPSADSILPHFSNLCWLLVGVGILSMLPAAMSFSRKRGAM